jgi:hypothetical protein
MSLRTRPIPEVPLKAIAGSDSERLKNLPMVKLLEQMWEQQLGQAGAFVRMLRFQKFSSKFFCL